MWSAPADQGKCCGQRHFVWLCCDGLITQISFLEIHLLLPWEGPLTFPVIPVNTFFPTQKLLLLLAFPSMEIRIQLESDSELLIKLLGQGTRPLNSPHIPHGWAQPSVSFCVKSLSATLASLSNQVCREAFQKLPEIFCALLPSLSYHTWPCDESMDMRVGKPEFEYWVSMATDQLFGSGPIKKIPFVHF